MRSSSFKAFFSKRISFMIFAFIILVGILFTRVYSVGSHWFCPPEGCRQPSCQGLNIKLKDQRMADGDATFLCLGLIQN